MAPLHDGIERRHREQCGLDGLRKGGVQLLWYSTICEAVLRDWVFPEERGCYKQGLAHADDSIQYRLEVRNESGVPRSEPTLSLPSCAITS